MSEERDKILNMVESGAISATEAAELLAALQEEQEERPTVEAMPVPDRRDPPWEAPLIVGIVVTGFGLLSLIRARRAGIVGRIGALLTLLLGLVGLIVGIWSRNAPWLYVDVRDHNGNNIRISLPLLLPLARPILELARGFVDGETARHFDNALAFVDAWQPGGEQEPLRIEIDDDEGNTVFVYIA